MNVWQRLEYYPRRIEGILHDKLFYERADGRNGNSTRRAVAEYDLEAKNFFRIFDLERKYRNDGSAKVFKATLKNAAPESAPYTVKRVRKFRLTAEGKAALFEEVRIMSTLSHPKIVSIRQFYKDEPMHYNVVLEYMAGGELFDHISAKNGGEPYSEKEMRDVSKALTEALQHCHEKGIVHRDINPSCLLLSSPSDVTSVKLANFDFACSVREGPVETKGRNPEFAAPEILLCKPHGTSVDLWSVGVIVYLLLSGNHPFFDEGTAKMISRVTAGKLGFPAEQWFGITTDAKEFVMELLTTDPSQRATAGELLNHHWMMAPGQSLAGNGLGGNIEGLRIYHAKRKLRAMVTVVLMARRMFASVSFSARFTMGEELGKGAYATVFKATAVGRPTAAGSSDDPPVVYAVKRTSRKNLDPLDEEGVLEEARILGELQHDNIVKMHAFFDNEPDYYYLVLEFVAGGDLYDRLADKVYYNEEEARDLCHIMMGAVKYMHDRGVAHRDLKPENLLMPSAADDTSIRLADFGLACSVRDGPVKDICGTPLYVAPEMLKNVPYDTSVDMWSVGVIVYKLLAGYFPFNGRSQPGLFRAIKAGHFKFDPEYWGDISDDAKDLIRKLLIVDPAKRWTAAEAMEHPWLLAEGANLRDNNLGTGLGQLKIFNAKRKLRAAIKSVIATRIVASRFGGVSPMA